LPAVHPARAGGVGGRGQSADGRGDGPALDLQRRAAELRGARERAQGRSQDMSGGNAATGQEAPIIIKKVRKSGHGHHGGAWKVAYADMVTALMALFIVLWILSQSDQVVKSVAGYFRDPIGFVEGGAPAIDNSGQNTGEISVLMGSQPTSESSPLKVDEPD